MSTSPTFNTVTARTINLANPGSMSAAGTVIARDITATGNIVANNGAARRASFSQVTATGNVTGANFITLGVVNAVTQIRSTQIIANNSMSIGSTTTIQNSGVTTANLTATGNVTGNNLFTAGRVSAAGNVSGNYILGNGYFLTGLAGGGGTYGNSNVAQYLPTYTGALTGGNLTVGSSTLINNNLSLQNIVAAANITAGRINSGTMSLSGNVISALNVSANMAAVNVNTTGQMSATGNVQGGNLRTVGTVSATGNISGTYIFGNGAFLTGIANGGGGGGSTYGNANVAAYLPTYTGALTAGSLAVGSSTLINNNLSLQNVVAAANITAGRINSGTMSLTGNVLSPLTVSGNVTGTNLNTTGQMSATGNVQGGNLRTVGTVSATGNITGNYIFGNGAFLTGVANGGGSDYGNANVAAYLPTYTGNLNPTNLSASGSVSAANLAIGTSTLTANSLSVPLDVLAGRNVTGSGLRGATMSLSGNVLSPLTVSGNVTGTNLNTTGQMSATGNVQGGNVVAIGMVSAIGNITGNYIFGNGAFLTGVANGGGSGSYGNANVAAYLPTYTGTLTGANLIIGTSTLTANSLSVPLDVVAAGTITGSGLRGVTLSLTGNVLSALNVSANVAAINLSTTGRVSATGNVQGGNVVAIGMVSAIGNITGNYIFGNGAFLTGIANGGGSDYGNANVAAYLPTYAGALTAGSLAVGSSTLINNNLSIQQDIVAGNTITAINLRGSTLSLSGNVVGALAVSGTVTATNVNTPGQMSATGNIQGGNVVAIGMVSAIGNITGNYIFGNGAFLTGIANGGGGDYGNANVAAYLPTYAGTLNPASLSTTGAVTAASLQIGTSTLTANSLSVPLDVVAGRNINGANLFGTIRTASQTGITQVGTLGTLAVAGEIQAGSMALAGALSATGAITGTTITGTGLSVSGSGIIGTVQILNSAITGAASVTATGNVSGGALRSSGIVSAVGAITGASVSASGNVAGLNMVGNGYSLTNVLRSNTTRTVYVSTAAPTSGQGVNGDIWYQTY